MKTKLVNCETTIYTYDFKGGGFPQKFSFETASDGLRKLILKNFFTEGKFLFTVFELEFSLSMDFVELQSKVSHYIDTLKKTPKSKIKYVALIDTTNESSACNGSIYILTNVSHAVDLEKLTTVWGSEVIVEDIYYTEVLGFFINKLENIQHLKEQLQYPEFLLTGNLTRPKVLKNALAEKFINQNNLLEFPYYFSNEVWDTHTKTTVVINVYSTLDISDREIGNI